MRHADALSIHILRSAFWHIKSHLAEEKNLFLVTELCGAGDLGRPEHVGGLAWYGLEHAGQMWDGLEEAGAIDGLGWDEFR